MKYGGGDLYNNSSFEVIACQGVSTFAKAQNWDIVGGFGTWGKLGKSGTAPLKLERLAIIL